MTKLPSIILFLYFTFKENVKAYSLLNNLVTPILWDMKYLIKMNVPLFNYNQMKNTIHSLRKFNY